MKSSRKFATPAYPRTEPELVCEVRVPRPRVACPHCQGSHRARPEHFGRLVVHKRCGQSFQMPRHLRLDCPSCLQSLRVPPEAFGRDSECKFCGHVFRAEWASEPSASPDAEDSPAPAAESLRQRVAELEQENHLLKARLVAVSAARAMEQEEPVEKTSPASATTEVVLELEEIDKLQSELAEAHSEISQLRAKVSQLERTGAQQAAPLLTNPSSKAFREACQRWDEERRLLTDRWQQELKSRVATEQQLREHQVAAEQEMQRLRDDLQHRLDLECQAHLETLDQLRREVDTARDGSDQTLTDLDMGAGQLYADLLPEEEKVGGPDSAGQ